MQENETIEKVQMIIPIRIGGGRISDNESNNESIASNKSLQRDKTDKKKRTKFSRVSTFGCNELTFDLSSSETKLFDCSIE